MRFTRGVAALREKERRLRGGGGGSPRPPPFFSSNFRTIDAAARVASFLVIGEHARFAPKTPKTRYSAIMENSNAHNGLIGELKTRVASASRTFDDHGVGSRSHHQSGPVKEGDRGCFLLRVGEMGTGPTTDGRREVRTRA